jgi:hypothetical protein
VVAERCVINSTGRNLCRNRTCKAALCRVDRSRTRSTLKQGPLRRRSLNNSSWIQLGADDRIASCVPYLSHFSRTKNSGRPLYRNPGVMCLGTGLGTSKKYKSGAAPSEATPDKRDMILDLISHNPKVVGSNPTPASNWRFGSRALANFFFLQIHYSEVRKGESWDSPWAPKLKVYSAFTSRADFQISSIRSQLGIIVRRWEAHQGS